MLPTNPDAYAQVPLNVVPIHASVVPFPQSMVIGVIVVALAALQVKFILYHVLVITGVDHVIVVHVGFIRVAVAALHD